ncbi:uncharacterized protein LOC133840142 [Drosophila sulfurigaster albostrigata]|uniref:uncharacterized protein LOC133840142 n=1 Tax=Drosophila sulfurigaster albostrigata TaxID=89887 RepID=UPI002D21BCAE|nr:uncharacterized protein LOC133840142 [Drosophila sulfurigaster albostrigata]
MVPPRMMNYVNRKGEHVHAGYMYAVMLEFIKRHNGTLKILTHTDKLGIVHVAEVMIAAKQIDFACYPKEPKWNLSGTAPLFLLKDYIAVPHAQPIASYWYFAQPFTWTTWLAVIASVIYGMLMLFGSHRSEFGVHFLSSWCHLLYLPHPRSTIRNWQQRVIHFILILSGFILTNTYLTMLSSILTSGLFEPQVNTLHEVLHTPYRLIASAYYVQYFKNASSVPEKLVDNAYIASAEEIDRVRAGLNTSFLYIAYGDRMDCLLYQQLLLKTPRFKKLSLGSDAFFSFPLASSLPYLNMLNTYLQRIYDSGIFMKMMRDSSRDTIDSGIHKLFRDDGFESTNYDISTSLLTDGDY